MATSRPPPLCGASESLILFTVDSGWWTLLQRKYSCIYVRFWLMCQFQNTGRHVAVMTWFAHQVKAFTPSLITFVTLPGKCQWFSPCALPPDVSGSWRDTSWKRGCSDHKEDVVIEPWEWRVADVADEEDAVIRLQDIKLLNVLCISRICISRICILRICISRIIMASTDKSFSGH